MFLLQRPSLEAIARVLADQSTKSLTYNPVGITRSAHASTLRRTAHRVQLGHGETTFDRALNAMMSWRMYRNGWTEIHPAETRVEADAVFAAVVQHLGFWSVNPCRVVYTESRDETDRVEAFAIGTLPEHAERGEERFQVEWKRSDDSVWFDIVAYAEPRHWLAVLGTPVVWSLQRAFGEQALAAMKEATR